MSAEPFVAEPVPNVPGLATLLLPERVREAIREIATRSDILFIGATAGTREVPQTLAGITADLDPLGYRVLALDLHPSARDSLIAWADGTADKLPLLFDPHAQGQGSLQILGLVRAVRAMGWDIWCFDVTGTQDRSWSERNRASAESFLAYYQGGPEGAKVLALGSPLDTRLCYEPRTPCDDWPGGIVSPYFWPSCTADLVGMLPSKSIHSIGVVFHGGRFISTLGSQPMRVEPWRWAGASAAISPSVEGEGHTLDLHLPESAPASFVTRFRPHKLRSARLLSDPPGSERPLWLIGILLALQDNLRVYLTPKHRIVVMEGDGFADESHCLLEVLPFLPDAGRAARAGGTPCLSAELQRRAARELAELAGIEIIAPTGPVPGECVD